MKKTFFLILLCSAALISCKKETTDNTNPTVFLDGKITFDNLKSGDTVINNPFLVSATATANLEMHGYVVNVVSKKDNKSIFSVSEHAHGTTISISQGVQHNLQAITPLTIFIEATVDHDGTTLKKQLDVVYKP